MMGGSKQGGKNNVLHLFKEDVGSDVIGIGCVAHIIHNTAQAAVDQLPYDVEAMVPKYGYTF
ncbi:hypothetical protein J437_LFUL019635 [Ladona fulva]|uniref:Uncharacterized protein n=1 Tax=Ladona fulva TaxID=123851 RepID=A0A8K0KTH6_LADFU|nr:hypothetical protein J437_LFUL019635 [Ladona fulva]